MQEASSNVDEASCLVAMWRVCSTRLEARVYIKEEGGTTNFYPELSIYTIKS
ncbi:hypothetical protein P4B35_09975 [Pontiellaceae bacterium B12227]|nr:hypothetical protein [Pontiellaceae bacterium B12227]